MKEKKKVVPIEEFKPGGRELAKVLHYFGLLEGDNEFKIICPFHEDINPSMLINLNSGTFYCFGCGLSGDAYNFIRHLFPKLDGLKCLKVYFRILKSNKVKKLNFVRKKMYKPKSSEKQALIEAEDFYYGLKTINWLKDQSLEKQYMRQRGFLPSALNLCKAKLTYKDNYPLVFPMFDMEVFKGWVCRTTTKRIEQQIKYLYNTGFSRANTLVGKYNSGTVVLVEGYMDWLKFKQFGVTNVAAILGWKVTEQQITKLKTLGVETVVSALDNDFCGDKGTAYLKNFFNVVRFKFPQNIKDPGELTRAQFKQAKEETQKLVRRINN